jgi:ubiquitin C-terminal hydrolase
MYFSTLHVTLILTLAILITIVNPGNYCFRNCALQIIAHIPSLREYILDNKNTGVYTGVVRTVLRRMLKSQCAITVPLTPFLDKKSFYTFHNGGKRE